MSHDISYIDASNGLYGQPSISATNDLVLGGQFPPVDVVLVGVAGFAGLTIGATRILRLVNTS